MMLGPWRWSPFSELRGLLDELDRQFGSFSRPGSLSSTGFANGFATNPSSSAAWPLAVANDDNGWHLRVALPGFAPEDVSVEIAGRSLRIRAAEQTDGSPSRQYEQVLTVPESVDAEKIGARFRHGLLELTLPYKDAIKPRRIEIVTDTSRQLTHAA